MESNYLIKSNKILLIKVKEYIYQVSISLITNSLKTDVKYFLEIANFFENFLKKILLENKNLCNFSKIIENFLENQMTYVFFFDKNSISSKNLIKKRESITENSESFKKTYLFVEKIEKYEMSVFNKWGFFYFLILSKKFNVNSFLKSVFLKSRNIITLDYLTLSHRFNAFNLKM